MFVAGTPSSVQEEPNPVFLEERKAASAGPEAKAFRMFQVVAGDQHHGRDSDRGSRRKGAPSTPSTAVASFVRLEVEGEVGCVRQPKLYQNGSLVTQ